MARRLDCEIVLALADVHERWTCEDADFDYGWRSRGEWDWHEDEDDDGDEDDEGDRSTEPDDSLELIDLIDSHVELRHGVAPDGPADAMAARVDTREVCWTKASSEMEPFQSEHEGYTGNAGNTLDRWYHRAAVVLWPRERTFVIRARASAGWAVGELAGAIKPGRLDEARHMAERFRPFWARTAPRRGRCSRQRPPSGSSGRAIWRG